MRFRTILARWPLVVIEKGQVLHETIQAVARLLLHTIFLAQMAADSIAVRLQRMAKLDADDGPIVVVIVKTQLPKPLLKL